MFCTRCGKKVRQDMLFCPYCGSPVEPLEEEEAVQKEEAPVVGEGKPSSEPSVAPEAPETAEPDPIEETPAASQEAPSRRAERFEEPPRADEGFASPSFRDTRDADPRIKDTGKGESTPSAAPERSFRFAERTEEPRRADEGFVPLSDLYPAHHEDEPRVQSLFEQWDEDDKIAQPTEVRLDGHMPTLNRKADSSARQEGKPSTYVPEKIDPSPDDLFLSDEEDYDSNPPGYDYEEKPTGSFFFRHIRGIVSLALMLILALILVVWLLSPGGQRVLARIGVSSNPEIYAQLGREAYDNGAYATAAVWYEKALAFDEKEYNYAYSAGVCYYEAKNSGKAEENFRKAIDLKPYDANAYIYIRLLYANSSSIPQSVIDLIQLGYMRTGSDQLRLE